MIVLVGTPAMAHRLDEYLQATLISVQKNRVQAELRLIAGVAVLPIVLGAIDTDADGVLSETEQRTYAERVLRDLSLTVDGDRLQLRLASFTFPKIEDMKEGRGEIHLSFDADVPQSGPKRKLIFENRHQSRIAAYLVNCLIPRDPDIRIIAQDRNYPQSLYQLDYSQGGVPSGPLSFEWWSGGRGWLGVLGLFLFGRFALLLWRHRLPVRP